MEDMLHLVMQKNLNPSKAKQSLVFPSHSTIISSLDDIHAYSNKLHK